MSISAPLKLHSETRCFERDCSGNRPAAIFAARDDSAAESDAEPGGAFLELWDHGDANRTRDPAGKDAMFGFRQFCKHRRGLVQASRRIVGGTS